LPSDARYSGKDNSIILPKQNAAIPSFRYSDRSDMKVLFISTESIERSGSYPAFASRITMSFNDIPRLSKVTESSFLGKLTVEFKMLLSSLLSISRSQMQEDQ